MMSRILIPTITLTCFLLSIFLGKQIKIPPPQVVQQDVAINIQSGVVKLTSFGMKRALADMLWIKTLLDSDLEHYQKKDLNSWMLLRFMTISDLDPKFYDNYNFGGQYLMVVKDDLLGSETLLQRGLEYYPDDLYLNFQTGYLYALELGETKKAIPYFAKIKNHPNRPVFVDSMYTKLVAMNFGPEEALPLIIDAYNRQPEDGPVKDKLKQELYTAYAMIDLTCLNEGKPTCRTHDINGFPYRKNSAGKWESALPLARLALKMPQKKEGAEAPSEK